MNETLEVILSRRSIRKYQPRQVPETDLTRILEAAILAPSARNQQKWHFTVVEAPNMLAKMAAGIKEKLLATGVEPYVTRAKSPEYDPFHGAPTLIMVSADNAAPWIQVDCGAAAQNIVLAAEALGLASCMLAMPGLLFSSGEGDALARELGFPEGYRHVISVSLGYREGDPPVTPDRKRDVVNYVR